MKNTWKCLAKAGLVAGALALPLTGQAAEIRVVDDAESPLADVMVACTKGSTDAGLSGSDGRVQVAAACREVYCDRGDRVNDQVRIVDGKATCHVRAGAVLSVVARPGTCANGCLVYIGNPSEPVPRRGTIEGGAPRRYTHGVLTWDKPEPNKGREARERVPGRWTSKPIAPGRLTLGLTENGLEGFGEARGESPWSCRTDLGVVGAGSTEVTAVWREPVEITGRVLDRDGKPVSDVPIFLAPQTPASAGERVWTCSADDTDREPVTGADGSFRVMIDPSMPVRIDAGWKNYPIGTATATLHGKPAGELVLRLK